MAMYRDLIAWQRAMTLVVAVYRATDSFPSREHFGLTAQVRRAAVSVPSNIAEGHGRQSRKEFGHHLDIAAGSLREVETQLLIAQQLDYLDEPTTGHLLALSSEVNRLITGLFNSLDR